MSVVAAPVLGNESTTNTAPPRFNYAEAMQKSLYFYEAQQSGRLSPNNRVAWRGAACVNDGRDVGHDLSGGLFDAGDHWTANLTMAWTAFCLATSAVDTPSAWRDTSQSDELLETLVHINDYFARCVLNPEVENPHDLVVAIGCGGREGVEGRSVHAEWAAAEVAHRLTDRPTFRVNRDVPAGDIPGAMAAAMAASAVAIREHADAFEGRNGFENFDAAVFSDRLLELAGVLTRFAHANMERAKNDSQALRSDGAVVKTGYRSPNVADKVFAAATWLARAEGQAGAGADAQQWLDLALRVYEGPYREAELHGWWKDNGMNNFGKLGALNLLRLRPEYEPAHRELLEYTTEFLNYPQTPGGLRLRERDAFQWGSLRHANNAAMIALPYSDLIDSNPSLAGGSKSHRGRTSSQLRDALLAEGRRQVDYALGANPYGRSYMVGFGERPFNHPHHRGAYGAWAGFEHLIEGKPEFRPSTCRHVLYGALIGGPDNQDVFTNKRTASGDYVFAAPAESGGERVKPRAGYVFEPGDEPIQLVINAQFNEVAIDYNAAFTANLAFLQARGLGVGRPLPDAEFPPAVKRDNSTDLLTTDREFFSSARLVPSEADSCAIELKVWNRSRWPARTTESLAVRIHLPTDIVADPRVKLDGNAGARLTKSQKGADGLSYIEIAFPNIPIFPGQRYPTEDDFERVTLHLPVSRESLEASKSLAGVDARESLRPAVAVYDGERLLGDEEPN